MEALAQGYNEIKEFSKADQLFAKIKEKRLRHSLQTLHNS
jgi:hypothetical protein